MSLYCEKCGTKLEEGSAFCPGCGTRTDGVPAANTSQPVQSAPTVIAPVAANDPKLSPVVSFWAYLGLMILFSLPVIGLIACIITCFAPRNKSIKHFALAYLVGALILVLLVGLVVSLVKKLVTSLVQNLVGDIIGNISDSDSIGGLLSGLISGDDNPDGIAGVIGSIIGDGSVLPGGLGDLEKLIGEMDVSEIISEYAGENASREDIEKFVDALKDGKIDFSNIDDIIQQAADTVQ